MKPGTARITILVDDQASQGLEAEHGLALWIEAGNKRILFDTGQGSALGINARRMHVPLNSADFIVISHGHYDHTSGIGSMMHIASRAQLVIHPNALRPKYSISPGEAARPIGVSPQIEACIEQAGVERIIWSDHPNLLSEGIGGTGPIIRQNDFEKSDGSFYRDAGGTLPDPVVDDQALWLNTSGGLVICVGCSHAGLINTINCALRESGAKTVRAVIGGFHLINMSDERLRLTTEALRAFQPSLVVPCHCSGEHAIAVLSGALGDRVQSGKSGDRFHL